MLEERGCLPWRTVCFQSVVRPPKLFWKFYVKKQGWRDGWVGFVFSWLFAFAHLLLWAKYWELTYGVAEPAAATGRVRP